MQRLLFHKNQFLRIELHFQKLVFHFQNADAIGKMKGLVLGIQGINDFVSCAFDAIAYCVVDEKVLHLRPEEEKDKTHFTDAESGVEMELVDSMPLLEWFANNYKSFG